MDNCLKGVVQAEPADAPEKKDILFDLEQLKAENRAKYPDYFK